MNTPILMHSEEERAPWNYEDPVINIDVYVEYRKKDDLTVYSRDININISNEGSIESAVERYMKNRFADYDCLVNFEYDEDIFY